MQCCKFPFVAQNALSHSVLLLQRASGGRAGGAARALRSGKQMGSWSPSGAAVSGWLCRSWLLATQHVSQLQWIDCPPCCVLYSHICKLHGLLLPGRRHVSQQAYHEKKYLGGAGVSTAGPASIVHTTATKSGRGRSPAARGQTTAGESAATPAGQLQWRSRRTCSMLTSKLRSNAM